MEVINKDEFNKQANECKDKVWDFVKEQDERIILAALCGCLLELGQKSLDKISNIVSACELTTDGLKMIGVASKFKDMLNKVENKEQA